VLGPGLPVSRHRTFATGIVPVASLGETLRFALQATLGFLRRRHDTGRHCLVTLARTLRDRVFERPLSLS
jgi:hypothetical protein